MENGTEGADGRSKTSRSPRQCKVGRLIEVYDLDGLGEMLEVRWTAAGDDRSSLRELATEFNRRLLESALESAGVSLLDGEVENYYRLLTDDEVTSGTRVQAERTLERHGIDVDAVKTDFVSHQAVHTYLVKYRGVSRDSSTTGNRTEKIDTNIGRLRSRTQTVTANSLESLVSAGELEVGEIDVLVDINVHCDICGETLTVDQLLADGGCGCHRE
ncbi:rod-determining factor RdfA [Haloprofundus halophilus]|uniref:rod-determining factor RdfA n=1 Tax=Haloprofundus halophilus TaxID=2283527 RepID=UPI001E2A4C8E|nr:rod-determining factor RdfA [Haloprofundus halophilus]